MVLVTSLTTRSYAIRCMLLLLRLLVNNALAVNDRSGGLLLGDRRADSSLLLLHGLGHSMLLIALAQLVGRVLYSSSSIVTELVVLELVHEVLLIRCLHSARARVEHHRLLQHLLLSLLTTGQHLKIVAVASLPRQGRHVSYL